MSSVRRQARKRRKLLQKLRREADAGWARLLRRVREVQVASADLGPRDDDYLGPVQDVSPDALRDLSRRLGPVAGKMAVIPLTWKRNESAS